MKLSEGDRKLVRDLREDFGVLVDVDGHRLDRRKGVILVTCPDCDQSADIFRYEAELCREQRPDPRLHILSLNGGALLIPRGSPLSREFREDKVLIAHIAKARELKGIETVALYAHAPCGAAYGAGMDFARVITWLMVAKERIKEEIPGIKVACFCHVDKGELGKRTYFVSKERYRFWVACRTRRMRLATVRVFRVFRRTFQALGSRFDIA